MHVGCLGGSGLDLKPQGTVKAGIACQRRRRVQWNGWSTAASWLRYSYCLTAAAAITCLANPLCSLVTLVRPFPEHCISINGVAKLGVSVGPLPVLFEVAVQRNTTQDENPCSTSSAKPGSTGGWLCLL